MSVMDFSYFSKAMPRSLIPLFSGLIVIYQDKFSFDAIPLGQSRSWLKTRGLGARGTVSSIALIKGFAQG